MIEERGRTALLVLDVMPICVPAFGGDSTLLGRLADAADAARAAEVDVIHVRVAFREGYPDVASTNKIFVHVAETLDFRESNPATHPHRRLRAQPEDLVVLKRRVSAFAGSDLELVLRSRRVERLVVCGVSTSGAVLSTLRAAADLDYVLTVLEDGCDDPEDDVHELLMSKVFPAHAAVMSCGEWMASL